MKKTLSLICLLLLFACSKKEISQGPVLPPPAPPADPGDARSVLLKDMTEQNLPAPYFHFVYDDSGYAKQISFADGFFVYELQYEARRLKQMTNTRNGNTLFYQYSNGKVSNILEKSAITGLKTWRYEFEYTGALLTGVTWHRFNETATDSLPERKIRLQYEADGNLSVLDDFRHMNGQLSWSSTTRYSQYDNGLNVDDFQVYKTFFENLLFLPQVRLQKNNPGLVTITSAQNDFRIEYSTDYVNGKPVSRRAVFRQTRGAGTGLPTNLLTTYSYY